MRITWLELSCHASPVAAIRRGVHGVFYAHFFHRSFSREQGMQGIKKQRFSAMMNADERR